MPTEKTRTASRKKSSKRPTTSRRTTTMPRRTPPTTPTTMEPAADAVMRQLDLSLGSVLLTLAQEGADEVAGPEVEEGYLWAALLRDGSDIARRTREALEDAQANGAEIDAEEIRALERAAGVIVMRESEGAVIAQPYASEEELAAAWSTLLADLEPGEPGSAAVGSPEADENPT